MTINEKKYLSAKPILAATVSVEDRLSEARANFEQAFKDFHILLKNKVLKENRSKAEKTLEKHVTDKIIKSCIALDNLNIGEGIMAMVVVALKEHLSLRDRVNELEFELKTTTRDFNRLKESLGGG